jgi:hypothetical protein
VKACALAANRSRRFNLSSNERFGEGGSLHHQHPACSWRECANEWVARISNIMKRKKYILVLLLVLTALTACYQIKRGYGRSEERIRLTAQEYNDIISGKVTTGKAARLFAESRQPVKQKRTRSKNILSADVNVVEGKFP